MVREMVREKKSVIFLLLMFILSISMVSASAEDTSELLSQLDVYSGAKIPSEIQVIFGNADINIHMNMDSGSEEIVSLSVAGGVIESIALESFEKPDLDVFISEAQLNSILSSGDAINEITSGLESGAISYRANGFWNKIKFSIIGLFTGFSSSDTPEANEELSDSTEGVVEEIIDAVEEVVDEVQEEIEEAIEDEEETEEESTEEDVEKNNTEETEEETTEYEGDHVINMKIDGWEPEELTINVGESITFVNARQNEKPDIAMVIGTRNHNDIKSGILDPQETYTWTFDEADEYLIVDGIITVLQPLEITVEE